MAMLKVDDIHVYYGSIHAVKGGSFEVNEWEIVTLIGANGAGKSTVLNTVSGLLHPRTGSVRFLEQDLKGAAPHKVVEKGLAQVPEGRRIFLQMTVEENLEMGAFTQPASAVDPHLERVYAQFPRLKERRKLVLCARESPLSTVHLRNLYEASKLGAVIAPPMLTYYNFPQSLADCTCHTVNRILSQFDLDEGSYQWEGMEE